MAVLRVPGRAWAAGATPSAPWLAVVASAALCAAFAVSPARAESGPIVCPFRLVTGLPCPGCGLTRSWVALAHGDLIQSLRFNLFGPAAMAIAAATVLVVAAESSGFPRLAWVRGPRVRWASRAFVAAWIVWAVGRAALAVAV